MDGISSINSFNSSTYNTQAPRRRRKFQPQQQETYSTQGDSFSKVKRDPQKELDAILRFQREARKNVEKNEENTETFQKTTSTVNTEQTRNSCNIGASSVGKVLKSASPYLLATSIFFQPLVLGAGISIGKDMEQNRENYLFPIEQTTQAAQLAEVYDIPFTVVKMANPQSGFNGDEEIILPKKLLPFENDIDNLRSKIYTDSLSDKTIDDRVFRIHSLEEYMDSPSFPKGDDEHKKQVEFSIELYSSQIYKSGVQRWYARKIEDKISELKSKQAELNEKYDFYRDDDNCYFVPKTMMELREVKQDLGVTFASTLYKQNEKSLNPNNIKLDFFADAVVSSGNVYKITLGKTDID